MIEFSPKQKELIRKPFLHCLDVCEGSPRSGKTFAATARFALHLIKSRDRTHLVVGYSAEQAYRLIMDGDGYGLLHIFRGVCKTSHDDSGAHLLINMPDGERKVYWKGGGKADSHKAITGMSLGSVYFCEINLLHPDMIQECFRRTYAAQDRWHIGDLNPPSPMHPVISEVFEVQDTDWTHWTCVDNPILTPERLEEIKAACMKSPFLYKRDWLGERAIPEGVIYWMFSEDKHVLSRWPEGVEKVEMYFAGDGGATDATSIGCYIVGHDGENYRLYRVGNWFYDRGMMAMSDQAREVCGKFIPYMRQKYGMKEHGIFIDPACKALRLEFDKLGFFTSKADNNGHDVNSTAKGIMCGIEEAQNSLNDGRLYLIDDPVYGIQPIMTEFGLYCMDDHGRPVDAYNHCCDELRYGHNHFAKRYHLWGAPPTVKKKPSMF